MHNFLEWNDAAKIIIKNGVALRRNVFFKAAQNETTYVKNVTENDVILISMLNREKDLIFSTLPKYVIGKHFRQMSNKIKSKTTLLS